MCIYSVADIPFKHQQYTNDGIFKSNQEGWNCTRKRYHKPTPDRNKAFLLFTIVLSFEPIPLYRRKSARSKVPQRGILRDTDIQLQEDSSLPRHSRSTQTSLPLHFHVYRKSKQILQQPLSLSRALRLFPPWREPLLTLCGS